jgi:hypothetical protein
LQELRGADRVSFSAVQASECLVKRFACAFNVLANALGGLAGRQGKYSAEKNGQSEHRLYSFFKFSVTRIYNAFRLVATQKCAGRDLLNG